MATPLGLRIKAGIEATGPISVADYFHRCLADPEHGYYQAHEPFGRAGDFVTAPEVSQLFGEMIAVFLIGAWQAHGTDSPVRIVEMGPGRATMMADILRVVSKVAPELFAASTVHLVETSRRQRDIQRRTLAARQDRIAWHDGLGDVPDGFTLLVANEFFDALPIRQFVRTASGFRERLVSLDDDGDLAFAVGPGVLDTALLPPDAGRQPEGAIVEVAPARTAGMAAIAGRLNRDGGTALAIDYGHLVSGYGDTLQALRNHAFDPPLAHPGRADLTSHVDFEALAKAAVAQGAVVDGTVRQGDFLLGLGLLERAGALGADKDTAARETIRDAVERLAAPGEGKMGDLFKVLAISSRRLDIAPFAAPSTCVDPAVRPAPEAGKTDD